MLFIYNWSVSSHYEAELRPLTSVRVSVFSHRWRKSCHDAIHLPGANRLTDRLRLIRYKSRIRTVSHRTACPILVLSSNSYEYQCMPRCDSDHRSADSKFATGKLRDPILYSEAACSFVLISGNSTNLWRSSPYKRLSSTIQNLSLGASTSGAFRNPSHEL